LFYYDKDKYIDLTENYIKNMNFQMNV